jgi:WD40 repeat protein
LAYNPDGTTLVSGDYSDNRLRIWDLATARLRKEIQGSTGVLRFVIVSPDGKKVAAAVWDGQIGNSHHMSIYDVASGKQLLSGPGVPLAYSPDGRWLAARDTDDRTLLLLDARTHETAARFRGHKDVVRGATFSSDSRLLASCGDDRIVQLWQTDSANLQSFPTGPEARVMAGRVFPGHTDAVFAAAFHPDGTRLATAGRDGAIWLWDVARGEEVARLPGHTSYVYSLAFSPDGATLASGSGDFTVHLWDTAPLKVRYQARRQAERLRPDAERLVQRLFKEKKNADDVAALIRSNPSLTEAQRHAAFRALLRRQ